MITSHDKNASISTASLLNAAIKKTRWRLIPFMLILYILAFLDRSNIGFAKEAYQLDTGLSNDAYALGAGIFFVAYACLGVPANLLMKKFGAKKWLGLTTLCWGVLSSSMAFCDEEWKFLTVRTLLGAAEAGFFPGMIYLTSQWFPQRTRASVMGLFYMGAPLALMFGSPLSGALLEMHGFAGYAGWFWMFMIEGILAVVAGFWTLFYLDDNLQHARFLTLHERNILMEQIASEESKKQKTHLIDVLMNIQVWHLAIIYMFIQISVYGLVFFLPTQVAALMGTTVGFKASLVAAIPWAVAMFGTWSVSRYSDKTGNRRNLAALTLAIAGIGIGVSGIATPVVAIIALCFAAVGFFAVQPVYWTLPVNILSGIALAAGIGFVNMFGAVGGFLAPLIKVWADNIMGNSVAGLLTLSVLTLLGALIIMLLKKDTLAD